MPDGHDLPCIFVMKSMHYGDGAIGEIDDLPGHRSKEMRIQSRQSA